jgi:2-keto-4-pentenoate hydratase/2-oxohepta-3-ene-1,7-dioic acid hydratase in catechol pathway
MKLLTFIAQGKEQWGVLIRNKDTGQDYALVPQKFDDLMPKICSTTSSHSYRGGRAFLEDEWPKTIKGLLEIEKGIEILRDLYSFAYYLLFSEDTSIIKYCAYKLDEIELKAPIPRPKFYWGLVQNSTSFTRNNPKRTHANLYPQGHQRPMTCVVGNSEYIGIEKKADAFGFNAELGIVIVKKGKYIKAADAMEYIAGYINIIDIQANNIIQDYGDRYGEDFFVDATASWAAKMKDTSCPMGPYLVTKDEVKNPYALNAYTRECGMLRDHAFTSNTLLGIERVIEYCSAFKTLYPGDVIHLGTIGVDGKWKNVDWNEPEEGLVLEGEFDFLGNCKVPVKFIENTWGSEKDANICDEPASPVVRDLIKRNKDCINLFDVNETYGFWTLFANYKQCEEIENMKPNIEVSRFLNNPSTALTVKGNTSISAFATDIQVCAEMCFVVKKIARLVPIEKAREYILGYSPMVSLNDQSFSQSIIEPATIQERNLPKVYARWGDGYNFMLENPIDTEKEPKCEMNLSIKDIGFAKVTAADYLLNGEAILSYISKYITLLPGDVVSLGRMAESITVKRDEAQKGFAGYLQAEGFPVLEFTVDKEVL